MSLPSFSSLTPMEPAMTVPLLLAAVVCLAPVSPAWAPPVIPEPASTFLQEGDPAVLGSAIESVTVYPSSALVTRNSEAPGPGEFVFMNLPAALDGETVRVRAEGLQVMGVETRARFVRALPSERLAELKAREAVLVAESESLKASQRAAESQVEFFAQLLAEGPEAQSSETLRPDPATWEAGAAFLVAGYTEALGSQRQAERRVVAKAEELKTLRAEIAAGEGGQGHTVQDVFVSLEGPRGRGGALELSYLVHGASWAPAYDLRANQRLASVELVYRADVRQTTGEDWSDVELLLSTANPEVGAMAPPLGALWLSLWDPTVPRARSKSLGFASDRRMAAPAESPATAAPADYYAAVLQGAGSLRYRVARRESIPSRRDSSRVLIGRADLTVAAEHRCVPALDPNVWLRARTTNDSSWVMLEGPAAVYFGGDFVGRTQLGMVRLGEQFDLDLGMDPGVTVERIELEKSAGSSGFFGSRKTETYSWRLVFDAAGAVGTLPNGAVRVIVQEVLPRSNDERLKVELDHAVPALSKAERWKAGRDDEGFLTWEIDIPGNGQKTLEWGYELTFPEDLEVVR